MCSVNGVGKRGRTGSPPDLLWSQEKTVIVAFKDLMSIMVM